MMFVSWFIYVWIAFYIHNKVAYVASVGAASYYFSSNSEEEGSAQILLGLKWSATTNFGSLAFGALIMTLVKMVRSAADN